MYLRLCLDCGNAGTMLLINYSYTIRENIFNMTSLAFKCCLGRWFQFVCGLLERISNIIMGTHCMCYAINHLIRTASRVVSSIALL